MKNKKQIIPDNNNIKTELFIKDDEIKKLELIKIHLSNEEKNKNNKRFELQEIIK